jgi:nucleoside-diphosphate-sugar epimerase
MLDVVCRRQESDYVSSVNVLITGHHGYIGSVMAPVLAVAGHRVHGLDAYYYEGCDLTADSIEVPALRLDVRDVRAQHLDGFDAIVHLAGLSNDPVGDLDPALTHQINYEATVEIARAAAQAGVKRFIFASSCSMYGAASDGRPVDEKAPQQPLSAYAESKVRAEQSLSDLATETFSPVFMRNATVYGVSPRLRTDLVLNNLVAWAYTTGKVRILSDGTPWRPLVHVRDVANATLALLEAPRDAVHAEAFNVGQENENYQVRELAEIVRETVPGSTTEYAETGDPDPRSYRVSFEKLTRTLPDLRFEWSAARGAAELLAAYQERGLTFAEFDGDRYTRLKRIRALLDAGDLDAELRRHDSAAAVTIVRT